MVTVAGAIGFAAHGRIAQFADYHAFADQRIILGIPHGPDVLSNVGFAVVGAWGFWRLRHGQTSIDERHGYTTAHLLFLLALVLTAGGSAFYHLAPDNSRLVWDRLPIALGCAALLASVRGELRPHSRSAIYLLLLIAAAIVSVMWWTWTDGQGRDDLRPYLFLQVLPLILIPLWQAIYRAPRRERVAFGVAAILYIAAKLAELNDHAIYGMLGWISGHSLKHLLATGAAAVIVAGDVGRHAGPGRLKSAPTPVRAS
jgi:hypothetical protein